MHENVLGFITKRRSIRRFTGAEIGQKKLETILKAAMAAPSANNKQPWRFLVVTQKEKIVALCKAHPYAGFGVDAGAVIIPFGLKEGYKWFDQDMAAATQNLLLSAANLGLGATWCGMDDARQTAMRKIVNLPDQQYAFALIPIGVPSEEKPARTQYDKTKVHWE
ncbi:nitroreductase family protein [Candidatus Bipolaricaulota bacterium]|nr:nitroreductase family protein [Candidatus Bipolaricaulota bacterium]